MKKLAIVLFILFNSIVINGQIGGCSNGITSVVFTPISGTNDLNLSIDSRCCEVHHLSSSTHTNNAPDQIVTLCYLDTGLLMPTNITTDIILYNVNIAGDQNFIINSYLSFGPSQPCTSNPAFNSPITIPLTTPITQPRTFLSSENDFYIKKTSLFPNPNLGSFSIDLPTDANQVQLSISDLSGKEIYTNAAYTSGNMLQLKGLSKGLYFAKVVYNQTTETIKFIVY